MKNRNMLKAIVLALDSFKDTKTRRKANKRVSIEETVPLPTRRLEVEDIVDQ